MIIVDDEFIICESLKTLIDWASVGVEVIGTADNGAAALELALKRKPDIILSDISMPHFNGLQLIETLRRSGSDTELIFISAYSRFDYAQEALHHGAFDYILKPINETQLIETVARCVEKINGKASLSRQGETDAALVRLFMGEEDALPLISLVNVSPLTCSHATAIGIWDEGASEVLSCMEEAADLHVIPMQVRSGLCMVLMLGVPDELERVTNEIMSMPSNTTLVQTAIMPVESASSAALTQLGLGRIIADSRHLARFRFDAGGTFLADAYDNLPDGSLCILKLVKAARQDELEQALVRFFLAMYGRGMLLDLDLVRLQCIELINQILRDPAVVHLQDYLSTPDKMLSAQKTITRCNSIEDVFFVTKNLLVNLAMYIEQSQTGSTKRLVALCIRYIEKNYHRNISLSEVAQELYLSPAYLSKIFSSEMRVTFSHHLQTCRIEAAKGLLRNTHDKVYEIAERVGYTDVAHFSKSFKHLTGLSPYQYRNR